MVTRNMLRTHEGKYVFSKKYIVTALYLIKCLTQITEHGLQLTCELIIYQITGVLSKVRKKDVNSN